MKVVRRSKVSAYLEQGKYTSQAFPGITVTPGGRIIASWRGAVSKNEVDDQCILYAYSDDGGKHWSRAYDSFVPQELDGKRGVYRSGQLWFSNGKVYMHICRVDNSVPGRPFFDDASSSLLDCKIFLAESSDEGLTWSAVRQLDTAPFAQLATPVTGPVQFFPDGEMFSQFELNKPYGSSEEWRHLPVLNFSLDGGRTFYRHSIPAADERNYIFYWDQRPLILRNGEIVDFFWTWDNSINDYRNITMVRSSDRGRSWTAVHDTGITGQPGQPVEFDDGTLFLPTVDRTGKPKIVGRISRDGGYTFSEEKLDISSEAAARQTSSQSALSGAWNEMVNYSLGLPCAVKSNDNSALVVWYQGNQTDFTDIEFAEVSL